MRITLKLFATLSRHLPAAARRNEAVLTVEQGTTVGRLLDELAIPRAEVHIALVNGRHVDVEALDSASLAEGDTLALWPPVGGG